MTPGHGPRFPDTRAVVRPHEHAVCVYDDVNDLLAPLDVFLAEGERERDLNVFVHSFGSNLDARTFLRSKIASAEPQERDGRLTTAHYAESFERGGRIDYDHVSSVVGMLHGTAKSANLRAPRIFVDASKNYFDAMRVDEWFAFESWLGPKLQAEVGLVCAYRAKDLDDPNVLRRVLETHAYRFEPPHAPR